MERVETTGLRYYLLGAGCLSFFNDREQLEPIVFTPTSSATVLLHYVRHPKRLSALEDEPEMPEDFHEAIVLAVLKKYSLYQGDDNRAAMFLAEFSPLRKAALKYSGTRQDATSYEVKPINWRG